jgi:hypothetical protein
MRKLAFHHPFGYLSCSTEIYKSVASISFLRIGCDNQIAHWITTHHFVLAINKANNQIRRVLLPILTTHNHMVFLWYNEKDGSSTRHFVERLPKHNIFKKDGLRKKRLCNPSPTASRRRNISRENCRLTVRRQVECISRRQDTTTHKRPQKWGTVTANKQRQKRNDKEECLFQQQEHSKPRRQK